MALFLDSADVKDAYEAQSLGFLAGITTNPSLMAKTKRPPLDVIADLVDAFSGPVWCQVTGDTVEERLEMAYMAYNIQPEQVIIKIPATTENFAMAANLTSHKIPCAMTAVYSPAQAYLAAQVGALYAAPYVNRMTRLLGDGLSVISKIRAALDASGGSTEIVAASLKSVDEIMDSILAGAHHVTIPLDLIKQMGQHELSDKAIEEFEATAKQPLDT